mmetsp:Transcript_8882/g.21043  ORF Transcript_8882/g.21043 Transcript_8882/m.21043 type:complete len:252 (-) Transcript_8882:387-1142(-)
MTMPYCSLLSAVTWSITSSAFTVASEGKPIKYRNPLAALPENIDLCTLTRTTPSPSNVPRKFKPPPPLSLHVDSVTNSSISVALIPRSSPLPGRAPEKSDSSTPTVTASIASIRTTNPRAVFVATTLLSSVVTVAPADWAVTRTTLLGVSVISTSCASINTGVLSVRMSMFTLMARVMSTLCSASTYVSLGDAARASPAATLSALAPPRSTTSRTASDADDVDEKMFWPASAMRTSHRSSSSSTSSSSSRS